MDKRSARRALKKDPLHFMWADASYFTDAYAFYLTQIPKAWERASPEQRAALVRALKDAIKNAERFLAAVHCAQSRRAAK